MRARTSPVAGALLLAMSTVLVAAPPQVASAQQTAADDFQMIEMAKGVVDMGEPISMTVLPDRSVLHTARDGALRRTDANGDTNVIGWLDVYRHDEEGLQGVEVDPGFATNRVIYLYYAPPKASTPDGGEAPKERAAGADWSDWQGVIRLSRFTLTADWKLDKASERKVLEVPADRGMCCHVGGDIDFDAQGNLYLSTGDDSDPRSTTYSPLDERPTRNPSFDAQRTSANTNDLRGKVLRIKVNPDTGAYTIPSGNMFAPGTPATRPEIYAMGFRNPFRMKVDKATGVVYLGDYGPDAGKTDPNRGPQGQVEFNRITKPGFFGWPYCTGTNTLNETYNEWDFATNQTGPKYNCAGGATNNSFRNTGQKTLPPAQPAWIKYGGDDGTPPEFNTQFSGEGPMAGPVYRYNAASTSPVKFPQSFDGHFFVGEFSRRFLRDITVNADGSRGAINTFPWAARFTGDTDWTGTQVMDSDFGPDGALYVLDYGTGGYFRGSPDSALYRIEYVKGLNRAPKAAARANVTSGYSPLTVSFSSADSRDPEGTSLRHHWDFGDGTSSTAANPSHTFTGNGVRKVALTVTDAGGATGKTEITVTIGNKAPTVKIELPVDGTLAAPGDAIPYQITVTDSDDGAIDCSKVLMDYGIGHDKHTHSAIQRWGCSGTITPSGAGEHDAFANLYGSWSASYTDKGANGQPPLTTSHTVHTQPTHRQAEHFSTASGVEVFQKPAAEGGISVGSIHNGDWIAFDRYAIGNAQSFSARVSSGPGGAGGTLQVRAGSPTGTVLGSAAVTGTGSWETFTTVTGTLTNPPQGTTTLYLTFAGSAGALFDVDAFDFKIGGSGPIVGAGGKCADVRWAGTTDGTPTQLWTCNGTNAQKWTRSGQTWQALGKCLDVAGAGTANGTKVHLWSCNGTVAQNWVPGAAGTLVNPNSGKCLAPNNGTTDGTELIIWTCDGGANQKWTTP